MGSIRSVISGSRNHIVQWYVVDDDIEHEIKECHGLMNLQGLISYALELSDKEC